VDAELLTGIYERLRDCEFKPAVDHVSQVVRIEQMIVGKKPVCYQPAAGPAAVKFVTILNREGGLVTD